MAEKLMKELSYQSIDNSGKGKLEVRTSVLIYAGESTGRNNRNLFYNTIRYKLFLNLKQNLLDSKGRHHTVSFSNPTDYLSFANALIDSANNAVMVLNVKAMNTKQKHELHYIVGSNEFNEFIAYKRFRFYKTFPTIIKISCFIVSNYREYYSAYRDGFNRNNKVDEIKQIWVNPVISEDLQNIDESAIFEQKLNVNFQHRVNITLLYKKNTRKNTNNKTTEVVSFNMTPNEAIALGQLMIKRMDKIQTDVSDKINHPNFKKLYYEE